MGPGTPYAIGAKFAHPKRPVIVFVGDGAFQMNGMNELITVKRYQERWADKRLMWCVFNNQDLNQVTWEQRVLAGDPKFMGTQWLPTSRTPATRSSAASRASTVTRGDEMAGAWEEALAPPVPVVLEVKVDPEIPPLPPHITRTQAKEMARAMVKGDPERIGVMQKSLLGKLAELKESLKPQVKARS